MSGCGREYNFFQWAVLGSPCTNTTCNKYKSNSIYIIQVQIQVPVQIKEEHKHIFQQWLTDQSDFDHLQYIKVVVVVAGGALARDYFMLVIIVMPALSP